MLFRLLGVAAAVLVVSGGPVTAQTGDAYFEMSLPPSSEAIVLRLTDAATIQKARDILAGTETRATHVMGTVVKAPSFYSGRWRFHVDPASVRFFSFAIEVCDSSISGIDDNLDRVGSDLLPYQHWCPWNSKLVREIAPPAGGELSLASVSAASMSELALAPGSIAISWGRNIASTTQSTSGADLPTSLGGVSVRIRDSGGNETLAPLFYVAPDRVHYVVPAGVAAGLAEVRLTTSDGRSLAGQSRIESVVPAVFATNGIAAATLLRVRADGTSSYEPVVRTGSDGQIEPAPIRFGPENEQLLLLVFGTGVRSRSSLEVVSASLGGTSARVLYAGAQGDFPGLDQINLSLPRSLAGSGDQELLISIGNGAWLLRSNSVRLVFGN